MYGLCPRGVLELGDLKGYEGIHCHVDKFYQSMREFHEQVKKTLMEVNQNLKDNKDERRRDLKLEVGDLVMVFINKARL